jgi:hypothetical protein
MPSGLPTGQAAVPQRSIPDTSQTPNTLEANTDSGTSQNASSGLDDPFTTARFAVQQSLSLASAPQEQQNVDQSKESDKADEEAAQPAPKTTRRKREPKLDENGVPIKRQRNRAAPKLDENGEPIKRKRRRASPKLDENGQPIESKRRRRAAPKGDGDKQSTEPTADTATPQVEEGGNSVKLKRSKAAPKLDENGNPIKRKKTSRPPRLDENGNPIKIVRRERNLDARGKPIKSSTVPGSSFYVRDDVVMRSTEGEEMTRGEFDRAFKPNERRYRPGGAVGGGTYEIIATGVIWSFTMEFRRNSQSEENGNDESGDEEPSQETNDSQRSVRASSSQDDVFSDAYGVGTSQESFRLSGSGSGDELSSDDVSGVSDDIDVHEPAIENTPIRPADPTGLAQSVGQLNITPARNPPRLLLGLTPPGASGQTRLTGIVRSNAPTHLALPPAPIGSPAATVPMAPRASAAAGSPAAPRSIRIRVPRQRASNHPAGPARRTPAEIAARVAELNERCRKYHVQTRDRFESDEDFLKYAEGMLPLLFPNTEAARNAGMKPYDGSQGGRRGFGGQESFI